MMGAVVFLLGLVGISWGQMHFLAPMNTKKEWSVFVGLMVVVAVVGVALILNLDVPSPMSGLRGIFEPIGRYVLH